MPVYFVVQVDIHDRAGYERYAKLAGAAPSPAGMKLLAMDDTPQVIEGKWHGPRTIIVEFPDEQAFRSWYYSPAYQEAAKIRWQATESNVALVKGMS
jgi:uncharacterized protein (DUF1330 family)